LNLLDLENFEGLGLDPQKAAHNTGGGHRINISAERTGDGDADRRDKTSCGAGKRIEPANKSDDGLLRDKNDKNVVEHRREYAESARDIIISTEKKSNSGRVVRISGLPSGNQRRIRNLSGLDSGVYEIKKNLMDAIREIDANEYNIDIETPSGFTGSTPKSYTELTAEMIIELIVTLLRYLAMGCCVVIRGDGIKENKMVRPILTMTGTEPANAKKSEYKYSPSFSGPRRGPR